MKKILLFSIVFTYLKSFSQIKPHFSNDTLYSACGYYLYVGQKVHILNGTGNKKYRFLRSLTYSGYLNDLTITITKIKDYGVSKLNNGYLTFKGAVIFHDGSKGIIEIKMNFEKAMRPFLNLPAEIEVPDDCKQFLAGEVNTKSTVADEIRKLKELLDEGAISQEEYDAQKKKLLNQ